LNTKLAIIGVGKWGSNIVRTISESPSSELIAAVTSRSRSGLADIAPFEGAVFQNYKDLDKLKAELDGVIVATPPAGREQIIDHFLESGIPVFSEKPLSLHFHESKRLIEKARRCGVPLVEDFTHLYSWAYIFLCQQISRTGRIEIESIGGSIGPYRNYSPVYDYGPHDLSMTLQVFKCMPQSLTVHAFDRISENQFSTHVELDFGNRGMASLKFGNTFTEKQRVFSCRIDGEEWIYDDVATEKLFRNGRPYQIEAVYQEYSTLQLALACFAGQHSVYSCNENLWLSESVAALIEDIAGRI